MISKVYQTYPRVDEPQMMLGSNVCSVVLSAVAILLEGIPFQSIAEKCKDLAVVGRLFLMGLCQATGQVFVPQIFRCPSIWIKTLSLLSVFGALSKDVVEVFRIFAFSAAI